MWSKAFGVDFWCFSFRTWGITEVPSIKGSLSWSLMSFQGVFLCWVNIWTHYTARLHFCWGENQLELEPLPGCLKQLPRYNCPAWWPCKPFSPWMRSGLDVPLMLTFSLSQSHPPAPATSRARIAKSPQTLLLPTDAGSHKDPSEKEQGYQIYFFCVWASWPVDWLPGFLLVLHIEVHPWLESSLGRKQGLGEQSEKRPLSGGAKPLCRLAGILTSKESKPLGGRGSAGETRRNPSQMAAFPLLSAFEVSTHRLTAKQKPRWGAVVRAAGGRVYREGPTG